MSAVGNDATTALLRALRSRVNGATLVTFEHVRSREWASITFTGARHELVIRLDGANAEAAADHFLQDLDATEFRLRGHILADIALVERERTQDGVRLQIEALTVEDG